jgi:hypothetical protein
MAKFAPQRRKKAEKNMRKSRSIFWDAQHEVNKMRA